MASLDRLQPGPEGSSSSQDLAASVEKILLRFGNGGSPPPTRHRVEEAVRNALLGRLARRDRFFLAHVLSERHEQLRGRTLLESRVIGSLLDRWQADLTSGGLRNSHWRGLFSSYLQAEANLFDQSAEFRRLRSILNEGLRRFESMPAPRPQWAEAALRHRRVLSAKPIADYLGELKAGRIEQILDLRRAAEVPANSWLWDQLLPPYVEWVVSRAESKFKELLRFCCGLIEALQLQRDEMLAALLDRFAQCADRSPHQELLQLSMDVWGSPQLTNTRQWSRVKAETKRMVCGWLALEDLSDFYTVCQQERDVDTQRLEFWLQFVEQISFSRILLGPHLGYSQDRDVREFRERKKGRIGLLTASSNPYNNAFLMVIGRWLFVEFSEVGNACYVYQRDEHDIDPDARNVPMSSIKVKGHARRWIHNHDWESSFLMRMRELGIRPDKATTRAGTSPRTPDTPRAAPRKPLTIGSKPSVPKPTERAHAPRPAPNPGDCKALLSYIVNDAGPGTVECMNAIVELRQNHSIIANDFRHHSGCLWLKTWPLAKDVDAHVKALGFRFSPGKGFWLK